MSIGFCLITFVITFINSSFMVHIFLSDVKRHCVSHFFNACTLQGFCDQGSAAHSTQYGLSYCVLQDCSHGSLSWSNPAGLSFCVPCECYDTSLLAFKGLMGWHSFSAFIFSCLCSDHMRGTGRCWVKCCHSSWPGEHLASWREQALWLFTYTHTWCNECLWKYHENGGASAWVFFFFFPFIFLPLSFIPLNSARRNFKTWMGRRQNYLKNLCWMPVNEKRVHSDRSPDKEAGCRGGTHLQVSSIWMWPDVPASVSMQGRCVGPST